MSGQTTNKYLKVAEEIFLKQWPDEFFDKK